MHYGSLVYHLPPGGKCRQGMLCLGCQTQSFSSLFYILFFIHAHVPHMITCATCVRMSLCTVFVLGLLGFLINYSLNCGQTTNAINSACIILSKVAQITLVNKLLESHNDKINSNLQNNYLRKSHKAAQIK